MVLELMFWMLSLWSRTRSVDVLGALVVRHEEIRQISRTAYYKWLGCIPKRELCLHRLDFFISIKLMTGSYDQCS